MINKETQEQAIALCQKLVQQKSYSGHEDGPAKVLEEVCRANGFDSIHVDKYGNFIACIKGKRPGKKLLFDGHMDTVPVTNEKEWIILLLERKSMRERSMAGEPRT